MQRLLLPLLCILSVRVGMAEDTDAARIRQKLESIPMTQKAQLTDHEWRKILTPAQFLILRQAGTEPPFKNEYAFTHANGVYVCAACGNELFGSYAKFDSGTGWPSFYAPLAKSQIAVSTDASKGMTRQEVKCARCGSHLGHVFTDGPPPTHLRYCLNSASLKFVKKTKGR
jgi:peptide-methionine (R)-S-oxide reductase